MVDHFDDEQPIWKAYISLNKRINVVQFTKQPFVLDVFIYLHDRYHASYSSNLILTVVKP